MTQYKVIEPDHLLLGLLRAKKWEGWQWQNAEHLKMVRKHIAKNPQLAEEISEEFGQGKRPHSGEIRFSRRTKRVLKAAIKEAEARQHSAVWTHHMMLALLKLNTFQSEGLLERLGLDRDLFIRKLTETLDSE